MCQNWCQNGLVMGARRRHWKEKDGRFYARMAVPRVLVPIIGKSELLEALGADLRQADRRHAAAVARLQEQINRARQMVGFDSSRPSEPVETSYAPAREEDLQRATWAHYQRVLEDGEIKRKNLPSTTDMTAAYERSLEEIASESSDDRDYGIKIINARIDYELMLRARTDARSHLVRRVDALRSSLVLGDSHFVDDAIARHVEDAKLAIEPHSPEWNDFAQRIIRAEIEALKRSIEHIDGDWTGHPSDPIVREPPAIADETHPVPLRSLFQDYIASRRKLGKHQDGAKRWATVIENLIGHLKHSDARKITKRDLIAWRDHLLDSGKSAKTVADLDLACVRAVLRWAFENDRLPSNEAQSVRQEVPRTVQTRERGFTTAEAVKVLNASVNYRRDTSRTGSTRESQHIADAKRWVPLLCAFTGARVTEMTQLRKEDLREVDGLWIVRITPEAGSVKTGQYRDVPLHRQVIALEFIDFVKAADAGPLFHNAKTPEKYLANARVTAGRLSTWLRASGLTPESVQPNHGWRHRFKTQGRERGMSERVVDAIQGHAGKTASDDYGDVTIIASRRSREAELSSGRSAEDRRRRRLS